MQNPKLLKYFLWIGAIYALAVLADVLPHQIGTDLLFIFVGFFLTYKRGMISEVAYEEARGLPKENPIVKSLFTFYRKTLFFVGIVFLLLGTVSLLNTLGVINID